MQDRAPRSRWWREPLVHFVLGGALLFGVYRIVHRDRGGPIVVSAELRERLRADFVRRTGAAPSTSEDEALLARHVEDELLVREATRLGLAEGDVIIRRRLLQKMQLLLEAQQPSPTESELRAHFAAHRERWPAEPRVDLVLLTPGSPLAGELRGRSQADLARQLGAPFATALWALPVDVEATLASTAGPQRVRVTRRYTPELGFADRRAEVEADWQREQSRDRLARELAGLRTRYRVDVR